MLVFKLNFRSFIFAIIFIMNCQVVFAKPELRYGFHWHESKPNTVYHIVDGKRVELQTTTWGLRGNPYLMPEKDIVLLGRIIPGEERRTFVNGLDGMGLIMRNHRNNIEYGLDYMFEKFKTGTTTQTALEIRKAFGIPDNIEGLDAIRDRLRKAITQHDLAKINTSESFQKIHSLVDQPYILEGLYNGYGKNLEDTKNLPAEDIKNLKNSVEATNKLDKPLFVDELNRNKIYPWELAFGEKVERFLDLIDRSKNPTTREEFNREFHPPRDSEWDVKWKYIGEGTPQAVADGRKDFFKTMSDEYHNYAKHIFHYEEDVQNFYQAIKKIGLDPFLIPALERQQLMEIVNNGRSSPDIPKNLHEIIFEKKAHMIMDVYGHTQKSLILAKQIHSGLNLRMKNILPNKCLADIYGRLTKGAE